MNQQTLFQKYGGQATVDALVDKFYVGVLSNDTIKHFFEGIDMAKLKGHQKMFVAVALGGTNPYTGRGMKEAHAGMGCTDAHFDAVADELTNAMDALGVSESDITAIIGNIEGLRADIVSA